MKSFAEALAEDRRLVILRLLDENGGEANESVLQTGLSLYGFSKLLTRDTVREDLRFLETAACISVTWLGGRTGIAKLLRRGQDCAVGRITIEGIKKPGLEE